MPGTRRSLRDRSVNCAPARDHCVATISGRRLEMNRMLLTLLTVTSVSAAAQAPNPDPKTDAEKIADALRAGPDFITKDATILDWPSKAGGEFRVLRKGTGEWTCLPGFPNYPHDEPGCF